jgi:membrane protein implicated in regulation of membrane protease activity
VGARTVAAIACLVVGAGLAAWSLANGQWLFAVVGFALIFTFLYLVIEAMHKAGKPKHEIKRAANSAWSMKDEPSRLNNESGGRQ